LHQAGALLVARTANPTITLDGSGAEELLFLSEWRWWAAAEIAQSDAVFAPRTLAKILPWPPGIEPFEWPTLATATRILTGPITIHT
jgi:hypothetical protein